MKLLLDTHTFIWTLSDPKKIPTIASSEIGDPNNQIFVSSVTFWEIAIKVRNGRLASFGTQNSSLVSAAIAMGFQPIDLSSIEAAEHGNLKENTHFDPFDRMLIWQAIQRNLTLVSGDKEFKKFNKDGLKLLWK
jgi:PIN domain nuclease of toxin-antitoxin system